jgi:hypothetical protein
VWNPGFRGDDAADGLLSKLELHGKCLAALASSARPITDAASARRNSHTAGNSTCVLA